MSDNNNSNSSDAEAATSAPLSAEYFTELANCPPEEINNLLAQPNLDSTALAAANIIITPDQYLKYLKSCMTLSPVFSSQPIENEQDAAFTKLFCNIRNAIGALSLTQRHVISSCGILKEMQKVPLNAANIEFLQCCILASQYRYALHNMPCLVKEKDVVDYLRFHHLKGIIYYGNDLLIDAIKEFNIVLQTPAMDVSQVMISAWKKLVLVKCTLDQKDVLKLPNGVSQAVSRYFKGYSSLESTLEFYKSLGEKFHNMTVHALDKLVHQHSEQLQADGNLGMVQRLYSVLEKRIVHTTQNTYSCIPIERLAQKLNLTREECVEYLVQVTMHQQRQVSTGNNDSFVKFTVDEEEGVVYFDSEEKDHGLENNIQECMELVQKIKELDVKLASSSKYQMNVMKATAASEGKSGSGVNESGDNSKSVIDFS
ncbi:hypothetical protein CTEN210_16020 [Chaetoceros tenuissimus]|uniref:COP9 signalosome complex subunit 3 n=1 Tax=Chaetoceros tenuissimus TaxID=426638 RepID=A0AAD3D810_9STRA|nr:hypothetical protein CTEN210_16020 [Chaetoceros tenuissimus]